jgi:hypothetical protein
MSEPVSIIDTIGPFFTDTPQSDTINWSKVPFAAIETSGRLTISTRRRIIKRFTAYINRVSSLGYNAVSIDDLAHMIECHFYDDSTKALIADYQELYRELFAVSVSAGMRIYVNTDYLFTNDTIEHHLNIQGMTHEDFFVSVLDAAFTMYPQIDGIILRIGENDGKDVSGTFLSKLLLKTPEQANKLLRRTLPLFEKSGRQLLFRTWTVGAYKIGDLIWNEKTYERVFRSISSDALIISMKYGDTDFMRYLSLSPLFFASSHKKILELQTRREWEGMGNIPSFVGWDYAQYFKQLENESSFIGIHVWCQTGGWAKGEWFNLTYLDDSSFWNELNTEITIALIRDKVSVEQAIATFCAERKIEDVSSFITLLRYADTAIKKGLYIADIAAQTLYLRRTRIPPLLWLTWDRIHLPNIAVYLHRMLLGKDNAVVQDGEDALRAVNSMHRIAVQLRLDKSVTDTIQFEKATLQVFLQLRRYICSEITTVFECNKQIDHYESAYEKHYDIPRLAPLKTRRLTQALMQPFIRESKRYRKRDRVYLKTSKLQARLIKLYLKRTRSHLADQSMGLETLFK